MRHLNIKLNLFWVVLLLFITSCSDMEEHSQKVATTLSQELGCKDFQSQTWNHIYQVYQESEQFIESDLLREHLDLALSKDNKITEQQRKNFVEAFVDYYDYFLKNSQVFIDGMNDPNKVLAELSRLEMGDQSTEAKKEFQQQLALKYINVHKSLQQIEGACLDENGNKVEQPKELPKEDDSAKNLENELPPKNETDDTNKKTMGLDQLKKQYSLPLYGAYKAFATAYQSCEVLDKSPMGLGTPNAQGITVLSERHPAGGRKRIVSSKSKLAATHYYIKNVNQPDKNKCVSLKSKPLIYDFGGKPYASTNRYSSLNYFKNFGSGTSALGTDCSGFVYTAYATAGLRLSSKTPLKAFNIIGIGSRSLQYPESYGYNCLQRIDNKIGLRPGDIVSGSGHVVMIDEVGADPFGLKNIKSSKDCTYSKVTPSRFNFSIIQSSPSNGGIGINRYEASDYFKSTSSFSKGVRYYAVEYCKAKFGASKKSIKVSQVTISRHTQTSVCKDTPVKLEYEGCLNTCEF
jgi:cell wall-associated NlpC family hydrolase